MKKTSIPKKQRTKRDTMRGQYRLDYRKAKPNRFLSHISAGAIAVVLEPDVAAVFTSSEAVNTLLRSVIAAMPELEQSQAH
ncbi:MAG: hypothetical protein H0W34_10010 [Pyrinomonadaceae bacterium]|nr:hypothetical protein [Pyrinomonadaceae bacterium]